MRSPQEVVRLLTLTVVIYVTQAFPGTLQQKDVETVQSGASCNCSYPSLPFVNSSTTTAAITTPTSIPETTTNMWDDGTVYTLAFRITVGLCLGTSLVLVVALSTTVIYTKYKAHVARSRPKKYDSKPASTTPEQIITT